MIANDENARRSSAPQARARREAASRGNPKSYHVLAPGPLQRIVGPLPFGTIALTDAPDL